MAELSPETIASFREDGAVLLPGLFAAEVAPLRAALDRLRATPGPLSEIYGGDGGFYGDRFVWTRDAAIEACVRNGPGGAAMAALLGASQVHLYCDHVLVKEPGTGQPTPWHHDLQAWPIEGEQIASLWIALDPVTRANGAVEFVAGSHRWGRRFRSDSFGRSASTFAPATADALEQCPDMDAERDRHRFLLWDMAPGDALAFHALTVHGAPGNRSSTRRRAISFRYTGDDVRWVQRPGSTAKLIRDPGLKPGDTLDQSDLFPRVFPAEAAT